LELYLPSGRTGTNFMGFTPIGEVSVVCLNNDGHRCSSEEMQPMTKSAYDS